MADVNIIIDGPVTVDRVKATGLNNNYISSKAYRLSQISSTAEEKADELTTIVRDIASYGIFRDVVEASKAGVPSGSFVLVDASGGDLTDVVVGVVPAIFRKKGDIDQLPKTN